MLKLLGFGGIQGIWSTRDILCAQEQNDLQTSTPGLVLMDHLPHDYSPTIIGK